MSEKRYYVGYIDKEGCPRSFEPEQLIIFVSRKDRDGFKSVQEVVEAMSKKLEELQNEKYLHEGRQ